MVADWLERLACNAITARLEPRPRYTVSVYTGLKTLSKSFTNNLFSAIDTLLYGRKAISNTAILYCIVSVDDRCYAKSLHMPNSRVSELSRNPIRDRVLDETETAYEGNSLILEIWRGLKILKMFTCLSKLSADQLFRYRVVFRRPCPSDGYLLVKRYIIFTAVAFIYTSCYAIYCVAEFFLNLTRLVS